jgi:hypothetical protein
MRAILLVFLSCGLAYSQGGFVHASGKELVSPTGEKLLLRGINLGNWLEPEGYMFLFEKGPASPREIEEFFTELIGPSGAAQFWREYRKKYITGSDIRFIRNAGFNSVRIPLHYKFFVEGGDGFELLDPVVEWCRRAGLYVILDLHCAPGGQTGTNIDDSDGYPWLYEDERAQRQTVEVWKRLAAHYAANPAVLGYDLLNEPLPQFPPLAGYRAKLEPLYKRLAASIREVDRNHVLILGGANWDSDFSVFGAPFDKNAMYTFHKYWTDPNQAAIQEYLDFRNKLNVPIWLGESGENTDEWIAKFTAMLERNDVGWCFWPYKKMEKTSAVVSIAKPPHWDHIVAYAAMPGGTGLAEKRIAARPSVEQARAAFAGLLNNIQLQQSRVNTGYLLALGLKVPK